MATIDPTVTATYTTAQVSGTVDPGGERTYYHFEYSTDGVNWTVFAEGVFEDPAPSGAQNVSAEATGLQAGTQYSVRISANVFGNPTVFSPEPNPTFTTQAVSTPTASIDPVTTFTGTTAHFSGTINPEALAGSPALYDVDWHFQCTPACPGLAGGTIAADPNNHAVSADASGLTPGIPYKVELVAKNAGPAVTAGPRNFTTLAALPVVEYTTVNPTADTATLRARINPRGGETTYRFEYGPTTTYGQSTATEAIPKGNATVAVRAAVNGLAPQSGYHFRVVATNSAGTTNGPDQSFSTESLPAENCPNAAVRTQQRSTDLGECRAYEMVSPLDKHGAGLNGIYTQESYNGGFSNGGIQMSADGDAVLFTIPSGTIPGSKSAAGFARFMSYRSGGDWAAQPVDPPVAPDTTVLRTWLTFGASEDGSRTITYSNKALAPGAVEGGHNAYVYDVKNDSYELIGSGAQIGAWSEAPFPPISVALPDLSTILFNGLEWRRGQGLQPLQVEIGGTPVPGSGLAANQISPDGKRTLLYAGGAGFYLSGLYLREEGKPQIQVSASQRSGDDPSAQQPFTFLGASRDLSKIYFASPAQLTDQSQPDESIYQYDVTTGKLTDLLAAVAPGNRMLSNITSLVSADGSTLVFQARGVLAPGAQPDEDHIYLWHNGDIQQVPAGALGLVGNGLSAEQTQLSSNGRYLALQLRGRATSYDSEGPGCEQTGGGPSPGNPYCAQVYVYDSVAETMRCASCQPDGEPPKGYALLRPSQVPGMAHRSNVLTDDGKVAFESSDQLVPRDVNEKRDVYTWQDGHLELISGGNAEVDSLFSEMSKDGSTVAFVTRQRLVGRDTDNLQDVYVSRVNGGFESQSFPPPTPADCGGADECRGAVTSPSSSGRGGSETFSGAGNGGGRSSVAVVHGRKTGKPGSLQVAVSGPGKIVVSGAGVKRTAKQVAKKGAYPVRVSLAGSTKKKLREKGRITVKVTVRFLPQGGSPSTTSTKVTFKQGNSKGGK